MEGVWCFIKDSFGFDWISSIVDMLPAHYQLEREPEAFSFSPSSPGWTDTHPLTILRLDSAF